MKNEPVKFEFALGAPVTDTVTGYKGTVTGRYDRMDGRHTFLVSTLRADSGMSEMWIEQDRLLLDD